MSKNSCGKKQTKKKIKKEKQSESCKFRVIRSGTLHKRTSSFIDYETTKFGYRLLFALLVDKIVAFGVQKIHMWLLRNKYVIGSWGFWAGAIFLKTM